MILPALTGVSLLIMTAAIPDIESGTAPTHLSVQRRTAAVQPAINRATECVAHAVSADPRVADASKLGDAIVDSMLPCRDVMRSMIDTYDTYFGDGSGEAFFSGPYLEVLPKAISKWVVDERKR